MKIPFAKMDLLFFLGISLAACSDGSSSGTFDENGGNPENFSKEVFCSASYVKVNMTSDAINQDVVYTLKDGVVASSAVVTCSDDEITVATQYADTTNGNLKLMDVCPSLF